MVHSCGLALQLWEKMLQLLKQTNTRALCATTNKNKLNAEVLGSITPPGEEFNLAQQVPFVYANPQAGIFFLLVRKIMRKVILITLNILVATIVFLNFLKTSKQCRNCCPIQKLLLSRQGIKYPKIH